MVDFAMDVFRQLYDDKEVPKELKDKRVSVVAELKSLQSAVVPITTILEDSHVTEQIQNSRDGRQLLRLSKRTTNSNPNTSMSSTTLPNFNTNAAIIRAPPSTSTFTEFWPLRATKTS